jgi:hypothetical protein
LGKAEAAAAASVALDARLPVGGLGGRLHRGFSARVFHVRQPERDRIGAGRHGQFVHEGFHGEYVAVAAQRAQGRHAQRHILDQVIDDALARKFVERNGVAFTGARWKAAEARRRRPFRIGQIPAG